MQQYHLQGKGFSGRAVRVEPLEPDEHEENLLNAAKIVGAGASVLELRQTEFRNGSRRMIKHYSDPCADPMDPSVKWYSVKPGQFDDGFGKLFTAKDKQVLEAIFRDYHDVTNSEVDAIVGKAQPVSAG